MTGDEGNFWKDINEGKKVLKEKEGIECPTCKKKLPKANPTILWSGKPKCKICGTTWESLQGKKEMNLYLLTQTEAKGYDTCSAMVVAAHTEEEAKSLHPCQMEIFSGYAEWDPDKGDTIVWNSRIWATSPEKVQAQLLGVANQGIEGPKIILYCFHAG